MGREFGGNYKNHGEKFRQIFKRKISLRRRKGRRNIEKEFPALEVYL